MEKVNKYVVDKISLRRYPLTRECLAEFLGTFMLITFGDGSVAQFLLSKGTVGDQNTIAWSFGVGITTGVFVSGGVSGGHINPAVSLAMVCLGRLPFRKFPFYALAQYLGGFLASLFLYMVYADALDHFDGGKRAVEGVNATAGIWATYPQSYVSTGNGFGDQVRTRNCLGAVGMFDLLALAIQGPPFANIENTTDIQAAEVFATALLVLCILAVTDKFNTSPTSGLAPFMVGYVVVGIAMAFGLNAAFAINPARDLGPRIFTACAGWGAKPFTFRDHNWFWVPIVGPHLGAILGALAYELCVGLHWPDRYEKERSKEFEEATQEMTASSKGPKDPSV